MTASAFAAPHETDLSRREIALRRVEALARILDSAATIPFTRIRIGADALLSLAPGGAFVATGLSAWLIHEARHLGLPAGATVRMAGNVALDMVLSAIPIIGPVTDVFLRANERNLRIVRAHLAEQAMQGRGF